MHRLVLLTLATLFAAFVGCSHYKLGNNESGDLSGKIFIAPVSNASEAPQIRALLTDQLRRKFSSHPSWRLASSSSDADYLLEVTVTKFDQKIAAVSSVDTGRGASYELRVTAEVLLSTSAGEVVEQGDVEATSVLFAVPGQPETVYQSMPNLSQRLSDAIVRRLTYY